MRRALSAYSIKLSLPDPNREAAYWLALWRAPGIGPARFNLLVQQFGSPREVFDASRAELSAPVLSLRPKTLEFLASPDWAAVEKDLAWLDQPDNHLVCLGDGCYPPLLNQIVKPPPVLFVHGNPDLLAHPQLAIVGTRNPSPGGRENAVRFAAHLASSGFAITSGLATGIDAAAHRGALETNGYTVAVMGTGPDRIYPAANRDLAYQIAENGALVTEFSPGTPVRAENFPRRNRLLSGLSLGVLVVEAARGSGSLITAKLAAEQGREVFAIPGSIHNPMSRGCHQLIREGAKLVETADDIIEELSAIAGVTASGSARVAAEPVATLNDLDEEYRRLLTDLGHEAAGIDGLVERTGLTADALSSMLLVLELRGYVAASPGGLYTRLHH